MKHPFNHQTNLNSVSLTLPLFICLSILSLHIAVQKFAGYS